jgi:ribonucleoside-diphosphate reductase alpha chain
MIMVSLISIQKKKFNDADSYIDHDRDYSVHICWSYVRVVDKYLVQDSSGGGVYETPQFMYMMIALTSFCRVSKRN